MTINEVIAELKARNRETASHEDVAKWCSGVDADISRGVMGRRVPVSYAFPGDGDRKLLAGEPWDEMYFWFCCAMIDFNRRQYSDYANMYTMFNNLYSDFASDYLRNNRPARSGGFRL